VAEVPENEVTSATAAKPPAAAEAERPENMRRFVLRRRLLVRLLAAVASGVALSCAFPPLELDLVVWVALLPILLVPAPPRLTGRLALGWLFGFAHYVTCLAWLNEVGFGAGFLLAIICAAFPMLWYALGTSLRDELHRVAGDTVAASAEGRPTEPMAAVQGIPRQCLLVLILPVVWVALEWVRGWVFTGFPWNQLGISQWQRPAVLRVATFAGVYGISFMIVGVNVAVTLTFRRWWRHFVHGERLGRPVPLALAVVMLAPVVWLSRSPMHFGEPDSALRVLAVQGNIPQCREWSEEQLICHWRPTPGCHAVQLRPRCLT